MYGNEEFYRVELSGNNLRFYTIGSSFYKEDSDLELSTLREIHEIIFTYTIRNLKSELEEEIRIEEEKLKKFKNLLNKLEGTFNLF